MEHSGTDVVLNISSRSLQLANVDTNEIIAKHDMPRISVSIMFTNLLTMNHTFFLTIKTNNLFQFF